MPGLPISLLERQCVIWSVEADQLKGPLNLKALSHLFSLMPAKFLQVQLCQYLNSPLKNEVTGLLTHSETPNSCCVFLTSGPAPSSQPRSLPFYPLQGLLKRVSTALNQQEAQRFQSYFSESKWYYRILPPFLRVTAKNQMTPRGNACSSIAVRFQVSGGSSSCWNLAPPPLQSQTLAPTQASEPEGLSHVRFSATEQKKKKGTPYFHSRGC